MKVRRAFSKSLDFFHNATLEIPVTVTTTQPSGKKKREQAVRKIRLFNLDLANKNKSGDVYLKVAGELLPGLTPGGYRGRIFPRGIFQLNANPKKDGSRILLAYRLCNRFDQQNEKPLEWTLRYLIDAAGLENSFIQNPSAACTLLSKSLKRLVAVGCIGDFSPRKILVSESRKITLYPKSSTRD